MAAALLVAIDIYGGWRCFRFRVPCLFSFAWVGLLTPSRSAGGKGPAVISNTDTWSGQDIEGWAASGQGIGAFGASHSKLREIGTPPKTPVSQGQPRAIRAHRRLENGDLHASWGMEAAAISGLAQLSVS